MKIIYFFIILSFNSFAAIEFPHKSFLKNCLKGYKQSIQLLNTKKIDPLAPRDATASQLCTSLYYNDTEFRHFPWVMDAISFLKVPSNELKLSEYKTAKGNCELGAYFALQMIRNEMSVADKMKFAKNVCRKSPSL